MDKKDWVTVNFSGGKDSTAMLLHMIELGWHIDEVICCDTYKEFPAMYRHIDKIKRIVEDVGVKFTELRNPLSFDYYMYDYKPKHTDAFLAKFGDVSGFSWAGSRSRWCTSRLKINYINKYLGQLRKQYRLIQYTGIAYDEQYRLERSNNQDEEQYHPLVDWKWTEADCLKYCYDHGYDWEGLYELFGRVSCWCCPLQPLDGLRKLRTHFPDLWRQLIDMDNRTWRDFKPGWSVENLDKRFALEDERKAKDLSISNREFFTELKKRINTDTTE